MWSEIFVYVFNGWHNLFIDEPIQVLIFVNLTKDLKFHRHYEFYGLQLMIETSRTLEFDVML